jgi:hypothetical protein
MYYWVFASFYTFATIIISQLLISQNIRIIFYLAMILLFVSLNNIYFSINYYIKLRNIKGVKGERGNPGEEGQDGSNGVCLMSKKCGIVNCRELIVEELEKHFPEFKKINENVNNNLELSTGDKKKKVVMEQYINILLPQCENFESDEGDGISEFVKIIKKTIKPSKN